jgi:putative membrane protein
VRRATDASPTSSPRTARYRPCVPVTLAAASGSWLGEWSYDPLQVVPIALLAGGYAWRAAALRSRGRPLPARHQVAFFSGLAVLLVALVSPVDWLGEHRLFMAHMTQHVLLGDLAPLLVVLGLSGPVLRPVLAIRAVRPLARLAHPALALPLWAVDLFIWHAPRLYDLALRNDLVHAVEHTCFFAFGALMWAAIVEPLPGPAGFGTTQKILYLIAVRLVGALLGNILFWSQVVLYPVYATFPRMWGISPVQDQNYGGAVMMLEGSVVTIVVLAWLFMRLAAESEARQRMLEAGIEPRGGRARRPLRPGPPRR